MTDWFGADLNRQDLMRRIGSMEQLSRIRPFVFSGGKGDGMRAFAVSNGTGLAYTVLESKCLDIADMTYKGINLNYFPKSGLVSPALADMNGTEFMRSISGGMLYTCGLLNVGAACVDNGFNQVFHGRLKTTPADAVAVETRWEDDEYVLRLSGQMREAAIFNDNLTLTREIATKAGAKSVRIKDLVENQGFEAQELMLLYHVNVGYPVLDEGARVVIPTEDIVGKDERSRSAGGQYAQVTAPIDGETEQVFRHRPTAGADGLTGAAVVNDRLGLGVYVKYDTRALPYMVQWKSMRSGDFATGIMPATCFVNGRVEEKANGTPVPLAPFATLTYELEIGVLEGAEEIAAFDRFVDGLR